MKLSRADHDDAIKAYAAMRASWGEVPRGKDDGRFKDVLVRDLRALSTVVVAYTYEERISRGDYGEYLRVLVRWLADAGSVMEV